MIPIIICEDSLEHRTHIETIVSNHILMEEYPMTITLSTKDPTEVIALLETNPNQNGVYILDINLKHDINGLALAAHIRENDVRATIVFATQHIELSPLTFKYKLEAMDYIVKDGSKQFANSIKACLDTVYSRYIDNMRQNNSGNFKVNDGTITRFVPHDDIIFFTTGLKAHKVTMHLNKSHIHFYGSIKSLDKISSEFFRTHKSFVVNLRNIKQINNKEKTIEMVNGEIAHLATKKARALLDAMAALNLSH